MTRKRAAADSCATEKLFTSTNVPNRSMQGLVERAGRRPVGLLHGLDEDDPQLFCPGGVAVEHRSR